MITHIPDMIISGMQSGADMGGLLGAQEARIATGGVAPKGWRTESGPRPDLGRIFGLVESESADWNTRTRENIILCNAVILICRDFRSPGSKLTANTAKELGKPLFELTFASKPSFFPLYWAQDLQLWLDWLRPSVVNIAGNRESKAPGIQEWTKRAIRSIFLD